MRRYRLAWRSLGAAATPLVLAGGLAGLAPVAAAAAPATAAAGAVPAAAAASCQSWTAGLQPPSPGSADNELHGVTMVSGCNAWAVGFEFSAGSSPEPLIERWNGSSWKVATGPVLGGRGGRLFSVSAISATNIWAVGGVTDLNDVETTLIEHWDGKKWRQVGGANPGNAINELDGVRAVSARNIWAVGFKADRGAPQQTLIEHYDGHKWTSKASPHPGMNSELAGVTANSSGIAWAVGRSFDGTSNQTLIERWNGKKWTQSRSPHPGSASSLTAVDAIGAAAAWAVGTSTATHQKTLILRWNGKNWSPQTSPNPPGDNNLQGVTAISRSNVWAVGTGSNVNGTQMLLLNWNGHKWSHVPAPSLSNADQLNAVDAAAGGFWAVGSFNPAAFTQALAVHCC
jgi:hypothetical protein